MLNQQDATILKYYGISPWEIEVVHGIFNGKFQVIQEETEVFDDDYVSVLHIHIPIMFGEEFFKWFEFKTWENVKSIFKEMKRRRGTGKAIKIELFFLGELDIRFVIDLDERQWFDNAIEKIDFVVELLPHHLSPDKIPKGMTEAIYKFDTNAGRWRFMSAKVGSNEYIITKDPSL